MDNDNINYKFFDDLIEVNHKESKFFIFRNFFTEEGLLKVKNVFNTYPLKARPKMWEVISTVDNKKRRRLKVPSNLLSNINPDVRKLYEEFKSEKFITFLKDKFNWDIETPVSVEFWKDLPDYTLGMHIDNINYIDISIQVYITEHTDITLGTTFGYEDLTPFTTLPYMCNFGYISETKNKMTHGVMGVVPEGVERNSIYIILKTKLKNV